MRQAQAFVLLVAELDAALSAMEDAASIEADENDEFSMGSQSAWRGASGLLSDILDDYREYLFGASPESVMESMSTAIRVEEDTFVTTEGEIGPMSAARCEFCRSDIPVCRHCGKGT